MGREVINRAEMMEAELHLGGLPILLADFATTGIVAVAVGPRGNGKTNAGLLMAEQLSVQGWVCVLVDPEGELESLYGGMVVTPDDLRERLIRRDISIVVVPARNAAEFVPFGHVILEMADEFRRPIFVMIDEGQLFSASKGNSQEVAEASAIVDELIVRGRKRAVDVFITALRFTGTLRRQVFASKNLTLVGRAEDPASWAPLARQFRAAGIEYSDLSALGSGEFFCLSRAGTEKIRMPMARALARVAPKGRRVKRALPVGFREWSNAMAQIPAARLQRLSAPVITLLGTVAGLTSQQMVSGTRALREELDSR